MESVKFLLSRNYNATTTSVDTTAAVKLDTVASSVRLYDGLMHPYVYHARDC